MCDVSSTVGITRCYKTEGFYAFILNHAHIKSRPTVTVVKDWLGVLETWVLVSRRLETRDPFLQVLVSVLVLEPRSLGLGLGLGTWDLGFTHEAWNWDKIENRTLNYSDTTFKVLHPLLESLLSACHLCSRGTDI